MKLAHLTFSCASFSCSFHQLEHSSILTKFIQELASQLDGRNLHKTVLDSYAIDIFFLFVLALIYLLSKCCFSVTYVHLYLSVS